MKLIVRIVTFLFIGLGLLAIVMALLFGHRDIPLDELKAKYAPAPSSFVSVDGMQVHYRDEGNSSDSIPVVLIHGTGSSLHTFEGWTGRLRENYRVITMDLPGYGLTGPFPSRDYSIDSYVEFLKQFLSAIGVEQCVLGGNSLGGDITWNFTAKYPEKVDKLILINSAGYPYESKSRPIAFKLAEVPVIKHFFKFITPRFVVKRSVENVYTNPDKITESLVDRYYELTLRKGNRQAFVDRFGVEKDLDAHDKITTIQQRTLVLWGDQDRLIPVEIAQRFHQDLPNDTLAILENAGHVPMEERPEQSLDVVLSFLESE
jgi:pimeloyl-ACP methyl ester carboxylesterase